MTKFARSRAPRIGAVTVAVAAACAVAACSSSASSSSASDPASASSASATPTASVIKLGIIANTGTAVNSGASVAAAEGAVRDVNARGGINGHPLQLVYCNENLDPNQARACARTLVSDHVMAAVSNQVATAETDVDTILRDAGIANVAPFSYGDFSGTDPNSYLIYGGLQYANAAMASYAVTAGYKRVAVIEIGNANSTGYVPLISKVVAKLGGSYAGTVTVPQVTSDLSTQAAALMSMNPDAVILLASTPAELAVMKDMSQLGYQGKFVTDGGQPETQAQLESLGSVADSVLNVSPFPPVSATDVKGIAEFRSDMAAEKAAGDANAPTDTGYIPSNDINAWVAVMAVDEIASAARADDAASFKAAISKATDVDLLGLAPAWTSDKTAGADAVYPRASNAAFYFGKWDGSQITLVSGKPTDVGAYVNQYAPRS